MDPAMPAPLTLTRILAATTAALFLAGCQPADPQQPPGGPPPAPVNVVTVEPRDVAATHEYTGQTMGYREVEVRARVTGILQRRHFREGASVQQGESLYTIDPAPFKVALARTEADLGVAQARLEQARRELARLKPVVEAKAASQREIDDAASAARVAEAEVASLQARVTESRLQLDYTRVEAPISGVTGRSAASEGTLVSGPGVLLTTVTQTQPMYVMFGIPDRDHLAMRSELEAGRLKLPAGGRFTVLIKRADGSTHDQPGLLDFTDVRVNAQTGTSEARAEVANKGGVLRPGEFVRVVLQGAVRPGAIVVPQRAVLEGPQGKFVYVVGAGDRAEARPVTVGEWTADGWIIHSGITAGDRVIVDGVMRIGPGAPVQVGAPQAPGKPPADAKDAEKASAKPADAKK